jgi:methyl-accepting chemotaxis protein
MKLFAKLREAFATFIETHRDLAESVRENTKAVKELQTTITSIEQHAKYLAHSEKQRNTREGRSHV